MGATIRNQIQVSFCGVPAHKFSFEEEKQNTDIGGENYGDNFLDAGGVIHVDILEHRITIISDRHNETLVNLKQRLTLWPLKWTFK